MWMGLISLFPDMLSAIRDQGVTARAAKKGLIQFHSWNPRDFTEDRHRTVDDRPYGGGPGMLMMVEPLRRSIAAARSAAPAGSKVLYLSPQGRLLNQQAVRQLAMEPGLILLAGRYEGIDERLIQTEIDQEWSIGDYVLSGGELPALVLMDAVIRLLPGVLGHEASAEQDSFESGLLDCPHYTRPEILAGRPVPSVLLSGHHEQIRRWRLKQSLGRTWLRRPDLLANKALTTEEARLLAEFVNENSQDGGSRGGQQEFGHEQNHCSTGS